VDLFPALEIIPEVFAGWKKAGRKFHAFESELFTKYLHYGRATDAWNCTKHYFSSGRVDGMPELEVAYSRTLTPSHPHTYIHTYIPGTN
jgi:hypothetical protein